MKKKIGIFGGTFDPIHNGHLTIAQTVKDDLDLDEIIFVPNNKNPFKQKQHKKNRKQSYHMVKKAIKNYPGFSVSDIEINRHGPSFSIDTVRELQKHQSADYYFIIGADILSSIEKWKDIDKLLKLVTFVVVDRPNQEVHDPKEIIDRLNKKYHTNILYQKVKLLDISSTGIRNNVILDKPINFLTPPEVVEYIHDNHLYTEKHNKKLKHYDKKLKEMIPHGRYEHSLGVMETSIKLADLFGEDVKKAQIAGLIHDCAKGMTVEEMLKLAEDDGLHIPEEAKKSPGILHSLVGPIVAKRDFGIEDEAILSAIRHHTTGDPDMNTLDKIVFLADYIEPGRKTPGVDEVREIAGRDLDLAVLECLDRTMSHLININKPIHITTLLTRNRILEEVKGKKHHG